MRVIFLSIISAIFITKSLTAQQPNPRWIATLENSKTNNFQSIINSDASGILIARSGYESPVYEKNMRFNAIEQYDLAGKLIYRKEYDDKNKHDHFLLSEWTGKQYLHLLREYDSKNQNLTFKILTSENLDIRNAGEKVIYNRNTSADESSHDELSISKDKSKYVVVNSNFTTAPKKAGPSKIVAIAFDESGTKLWEKEILSTDFDNYFSETRAAQINNQGDVAILRKNYEKENTSKRNSYEVGKVKTDGFSYELIYISDNGGNVSRTKIALEHGVITDAVLSADSEGNIDLTGLFGSPKDNAVKGTFHASVNRSGKIENINTDKFSAEFVGQFNAKHTSDVDATALHANFTIAQVEYRNDGGLYLISEYTENYYTRSSAIPTGYIINGYIIVSSIDKNGKAVFHKKIPKFHSDTDAFCSSFYGFVSDEKLHLIYNENKDNVQKPFDKSFLRVMFTKSSTIMRSVDAQGRISSVELWQNKDISTVFRPMFTHLLNENTIVFSPGGNPYYIKPVKIGVFSITK